MNREYCNHTLYQFFIAKALKLEEKLCQRDDELHSAQESLGSKDKEIQELKEQLKRKQQDGAVEGGLRQDMSSLRGDLEKARTEAVSAGTSSKGFPFSLLLPFPF